MNLQEIREQHIVERYIANELGQSEREAFEIACMEDQTIADELESVLQFKHALIDELPSVNIAKESAGPVGFYRTWAVAATVFLGVGMAVVASPVLDFQNGFDMEPRTIAGEYLLQTYRSSNEWKIPHSKKGDALLKLDVGPQQHDAYRVVIELPDEKYKWAQDNISRSIDGDVLILFPAANPGHYTLTLSPSNSDTIITQHSIEVLQQ